MPRKPRAAFDTPLETTPVEGEVAITGPGHMHGALTPEAARQSAESLAKAADEAEEAEGTEAGDDPAS